MRNRILSICLLTILSLSACGTTGQPAITSSPTTTSATQPTKNASSFPDAGAILYEQDFESFLDAAGMPSRGTWQIETEADGNHIYCNGLHTDWSGIQFGWPTWQDYAVEVRVKIAGEDPASGLELYSRIDTGYEGYRGSFGLQGAGIGYYPPPQYHAGAPIQVERQTWYRLVLEAFEENIRFLLDDQPILSIQDGQSKTGLSGVGVAPGSLVCVDDIRVWALSDDETTYTAPVVLHPDLVPVTTQAAVGDGGNQWGGHQTRIVRTQDGVFTAYTEQGSGHFGRVWHLAWRQADGTWRSVAEGVAGKDPVNLLASPDGTLHIVGWPNQLGTIWSGKPKNGQIKMTLETIPGVAYSNWPYGSAGIDLKGNLCVLSSVGGEKPGGEFKWACYLAEQQQWISKTTHLDYRYCYTYLFPGPGGQLTLISNRDVLWSALGYTQPADVFEYVFNAVGMWHTDDIAASALTRTLFLEEPPTETDRYVFLDAQEDAYLDTAGNVHILYRKLGGSTLNQDENHHLVTSPQGEVLADVLLPAELGGFVRIFQDAGGQFYLLGSSGVLYPAGHDGLSLGQAINIDLGSYVVEYSGFGISVPRTGTPLSNVLDVVFPSGGGTQWIYFQLQLP
jgi:hypothetical protein